MNIEKFRFYDAMPQFGGSDEYAGFIKSGVSSVGDLFAELERALSFPWYFGNNWNAVFDCLRDFHWRRESEIILVHDDVPALVKDDLALYLEVLIDSIVDWERDGTRRFRVFFPSSAKDTLLDV